MGHNPKQTKQTAAQIVLNLLPKDGSPVTWGHLKKLAKEFHPHLSPSTLSNHLKRFIRYGVISREEVDTGRKLPTVFYRRIVSREPDIETIQQIQKKVRLDEEFDNILILLITQFYDLIYHFTNLFFDASKRKNVNEAKEFVLQMLDASAIPHILALTEACYGIKDLKKDVWPVLDVPSLYFVSKKIELLEKLKERKLKSDRYKDLEQKLVDRFFW